MPPFKELIRIRPTHEIAPDEIFLDSSNLPSRDDGQFEGRVVKPVSPIAMLAVGFVFFLILVMFGIRAYGLQVTDGEKYANISRNNRLDKHVLFALRGLIYDRTGRELAWNEAEPETATTTGAFPLRRYTNLSGLSHILGFVRYPKADAHGAWWRDEYSGISGVERSFNALLSGANGSVMTETDAHGHTQSQGIIAPAQKGQDLTLSIDADVQQHLYEAISSHAATHHFVGGAGVIIDVHTGELLALTSFPEYDHIGFNNGDNAAIAAASQSTASPLLDRAIAGLYAPGSIVKPIFAAAALEEGVISPEKEIVSTGKLTLPNPYDPEHPSIFKDWTVHGSVDMRTAIAVSSDEYFYVIGGGFAGQKGLGITRIDKYAKLFGLSTTTGIALMGEESGNIPTPSWKERIFGADDPWRIGDTYHTAIGQYGFQITPIQAAAYTAAIANGGTLLVPQLLAHATGTPPAPSRSIGVSNDHLQIVREGMRLAVTSDRHDATAKALNVGGIHIAGKTGTAQIGNHNQWMNSWSIGFWPAEHPRYAFAVVLERAPAGTASGAAPSLAPFFRWLVDSHPEYIE